MDHNGISPAIGLKIGDGACQVAGIGRIATWHRTSDQLPLQGHGFLPAATLLAGTAGSTQCPNASDSGHEEISQDLQSTPGLVDAGGIGWHTMASTFFTRPGRPDVPNYKTSFGLSSEVISCNFNAC